MTADNTSNMDVVKKLSIVQGGCLHIFNEIAGLELDLYNRCNFREGTQN